jgi:hypothetical protein
MEYHNIQTEDLVCVYIYIYVAPFKPIIPMFNQCKTLQPLSRKTTLKHFYSS